MLNLSQSFSSLFPPIFLLTTTFLMTQIRCQTNNYLLNCGAPTNTIDNRTWYTDENPSFAPLAAYKGATKVARITKEDTSSFGKPPCTGARIFHSPFTYSFPVSPGPKFVRLLFCAFATYDNTSGENFFVSLEANGGGGPFTLLHNFSAYLHQKQFEKSVPGPIGKEFLVMANTSRLNLTFSPTNADSLAFVNSIEILAEPDNLYDYFNPSVQYSETSSVRSTPCLPAKDIISHLSYSILKPTALETVVRLNVGGTDITNPENDYGELSRAWYKDDIYLNRIFIGEIPNKSPLINYTPSLPEYTAPRVVYETARVMGSYNDSFKLKNNITWEFFVDFGFDYLIRLHFCEINPQVTGSDQRVFDVFINNEKADTGVDVMYLAGEQRDIPVCRDYVAASIDSGGIESVTKANLWVTLRPDAQKNYLYHDVILNGLEIFKLSHRGNLAGSNPAPQPNDPNQPDESKTSPRGGRSSSHYLIIEIIVGVLGIIVIILLITALAFCWRKPTGNECKRLLPSDGSDSNYTSNSASSLPSHLCHRFTLQQIKITTSNFEEDFVIGVGGFGKVYKGSIAMDGGTEVMVAIKRLDPTSKQGAHEFRTEIEMLTALRHVHLVSLIGYCDENAEMVLVYDYMPLGTLQDHLYRAYNSRNKDIVDTTNYAPMSWKRRLITCIGVARGLHYLHTGAKRIIIHRDVKSSNILLNKNWIAKVSDFGISKVGPYSEEGGPTYISTLVRGSIGYLDPEYLRLTQLTEKSDVYSFGVVLFEVLCARRAMIHSLPTEQVNLARYARRCFKEDTLHEIVDPNVREEIAPECLRKFGEIAEMCVRDHGSERPSMEEVVW